MTKLYSFSVKKNQGCDHWDAGAMIEATDAIISTQGIPGESFSIFRHDNTFAVPFLRAKKVHERLLKEWTDLYSSAN